jgi:hypothetical protein
MDDKDKTGFDKMVETATSAIGEPAKDAVMPTQDTEGEALAEKTNDQMFLGDAAIAPEAVPAPVTPKETGAKKRKRKSTKQLAQLAKSAKKSMKAAPKKAAKKSTKKSKTKSAVKKSQLTAKKATRKTGKTAKQKFPKKKAKKSKR